MAEQKYKAYRYYNGVCSSGNFVAEIAKALSIGVRSNEIRDVQGNVLLEPFVLQSKNWDIVYPAPDSSIAVTQNMSADEYVEKINNQVNQISDTVILKTTTTPQEVDKNADDIAIDSDVYKESLTMYLEIYKPTYITNPEIYPLDCERHGIIPKVTTKDMYKESYKQTKRIEEIITLDTNNCCNTSTMSTINSGVKNFNVMSECFLYVAKIINIYGDMAGIMGFYTPTIPGDKTQDLVLNKSQVLNIKSRDNDLYSLIKTVLNIDDSTYQNITSITFNVKCSSDTDFSLFIEAETVKNIYTLANGSSYTLLQSKVDDELVSDVIPEYYLDGVYIPLDRDLWTYDPTVVNNRGILFKDNISGDIVTNGHIVVRYDVVVPPDENVSERGTLLNNHYVLMRLFDDLNEEGNGPSLSTYSDNGEIAVQRAHISEWSKLSWYKDFEEIYKDDIDADTSTNVISDGTLFVPLETAGLNSETKIRYWLNTNNDRFNLIVMGNPSLDYLQDRHLIGACYCGRIDSFDFSANDIAGNFALFTSASTEPCKTEMNIENEYNRIDFEGTDYTTPEFTEFLNKAYSTPCINEELEYYIQLPDNEYFNQKSWPKYMIVDVATGIPLTDLQTVYRINYLDKDSAIITIHDSFDETFKLVLAYEYYTEKVILNGGVERDAFGNVLNVTKPDKWGLNTSDGTTSIMMYHTQSNAYYQKHQMMFTTTEEYMSKVMYGKSMYTGEYYADRIKVTHGNDGPRGMLNDMLVIDNSSLYAFDELVINKDFEKDPNDYEETYIYFPITAPYSPLSDSPNARYGLAIKEKEVEPNWSDVKVKIKLALQELELISENWNNITSDIYPLGQTTNGCSVLWEVVNGTGWYQTTSNNVDYTPIDLCLNNTGYMSNSGVVLTPDAIDPSKVTDTSTPGYVGDVLTSLVDYTTDGFTQAASANAIYYGILKTTNPIELDDIINVTITPENNTGVYAHSDYIYPIKNYYYCGKIDTEQPVNTLKLKDAKPGSQLVLYGVEETATNSVIKNYGLVTLTQDMLKYPCEIQTTIATGFGALVSSPIQVVNYGDTFTLSVSPDIGYIIGSVEITDSDGNQTIKGASDMTNNSNGVYSLDIVNIKRNTTITVNLTT